MPPNAPPSRQHWGLCPQPSDHISRRQIVVIWLVWLWIARFLDWNLTAVSALRSRYEREGYTIYSDHIYVKKDHDNTTTVIINNPPHIYWEVTWVQNLIIEGSTIVLRGWEKTKILARFDISLLGVNKEKFIEDISR